MASSAYAFRVFVATRTDSGVVVFDAHSDVMASCEVMAGSSTSWVSVSGSLKSAVTSPACVVLPRE